MAGMPLLKQRAAAAHNATDVRTGSAVALKSGQGRASRPEVAVIFAANQRLSASMIIPTIAAADGAKLTIASMRRSASALMEASLKARNRSRKLRIVFAMAAASEPNVSSVALVENTAKPAIQTRMRPDGYHSSAAAALDAPWSGKAPWPTGRPSRQRRPSQQAGNATPTAYVMPSVRPKAAPRPIAAAMPPMAAESG